ncbi:MAG: beta-glucosidase, partial [Rudaea sp.]
MGAAQKQAHLGQSEEKRRPKHRAIFPTFFMAGFESSTFVWKDGRRKDYIVLTGHDRHLEQDYEDIMDLGIATVREAIRWPLVDRGDGRYDWSSVEPVVKALTERNMAAIWDLCHYGFPDNCNPFSDECFSRYVDYCRAAGEYVKNNRPAPHLFTPMNEITFFAAAATDMGWMYPFAKGQSKELKRRLCHMTIEAVKAIREVDPDARMVHPDPLIHTVPAQDDPNLEEKVKEGYKEAFEAWDMLYGRLHPELGGSPKVLDIVGVNVYNYSQAQMNKDGSRVVLGPKDPRRESLHDMLMEAWQRYRRPIAITETSGYRDKRAEWLRMTMRQSLRALNDGIDLQGICLFPSIDMPDWQTGEW